jgi:hypothetical protein
MMKTLAIIVIAVIGMVWFDHQGYSSGYEQGRKDKHAEIMEFISGDKTARIAIVSENKVEYHPAGICAECHGG